MGDWITVEVECAFYLSEGREKVLCDRLPRPVTLVMKLTRAGRAALSPDQGEPK